MADKYNIAIDARRLRATTGRYTRELLNNLQKIDTENTYHVIIHKDDEGKWQPYAKNFKLHIVEWDHYTFGEQIGLLRFLHKLNPDLVHFTMPQQPLFYGKPKTTTVHDLTLVKFKSGVHNPVTYTMKQLIFKVLLKRVIKTSLAIYTLAEYTRAEIAAYGKVPATKVVIAHPASDAMAKKDRVYPEAEDKEFVLYVGNTFPYKNISRLIQAQQKLLQKHPKLHVVAVGKIDDNVKVLQKEVKDNGYKQVIFTGFVDEEQLAWLYKNAKAYVFPSLSEGFGMPSLEAMQYDLPVVSSDATVLPEINGEAAHYFNPEDVDEMAKSIHEVLSDDKLRQTLIENGRKQRNLYSWNKMAKKIHANYMEVLKDKTNA